MILSNPILSINYGYVTCQLKKKMNKSVTLRNRELHHILVVVVFAIPFDIRSCSSSETKHFLNLGQVLELGCLHQLPKYSIMHGCIRNSLLRLLVQTCATVSVRNFDYVLLLN